MCSNIGTPNNHNFPYGTNGKVVVLGVPILKDGLPYIFHSFRNKYFNKISLGNLLYFQNKL